MRPPLPARWVAISVFILASVLNYLDRQILATMVDIWRARPEFPFTYDDYGLLLSVFSIAYAVSALFAGWFVDRVGLNRGTIAAVAVWAIASFGTGASHSVRELLIWRAVLGAAEAGAIAAVTKAVAMYLLPPERAVGQAMSQLGLSLGAGLAPAFAVYFSYRYSWHWSFYAAGLLSLAWIPVWLITSRAIPPVAPLKSATAASSFGLLRDPRLWALMVANMFGMALYSLWANWAPTYLVHVQHLTPPQASHYTWIGAHQRILRRPARRRHLVAARPVRPHAHRCAQAGLSHLRSILARNHGRAAGAQSSARHSRNVTEFLLGVCLERQSLHAAH